MPTQPKPFDDISTSASDILVPSGRSGTACIFQHRAELAAGMQHAEIDRGKAAALQQRDRQRIAEREQHQRGGGRREVMRTSLAGLRQRQRDIGGLAQGGVAFRRHRHQRDAEALGIGDEVLHLGLLAGPRQGHDDVIGGDHAEVAVAGFGGVHEKGGGAGGGEGGGDLARHMP
jgi:hypothetical protein